MPRVKRGFKARRRRNKVLSFASGYYGSRGRTYRAAVEQVHNAWEDAYRHRREKKREFRRLWIARINAAARMYGWTYSRLIAALKTSGVELDRRTLADLAMHDLPRFKAVLDSIQ